MDALQKKLQAGREKLVKYLATSDPDDEDIPPSINTRISSSEEMKMFLRYAFLADNGVEAAQKFHTELAQHGISKRGLGRREAVEAIRSTPAPRPSGPAQSYSYRPGGEE